MKEDSCFGGSEGVLGTRVADLRLTFCGDFIVVFPSGSARGVAGTSALGAAALRKAVNLVFKHAVVKLSLSPASAVCMCV